MQGMNIAVVGGASGFGLETAKLMVRDGVSKIVVIDINQERLDAAKESWPEKAPRFSRSSATSHGQKARTLPSTLRSRPQGASARQFAQRSIRAHRCSKSPTICGTLKMLSTSRAPIT